MTGSNSTVWLPRMRTSIIERVQGVLDVKSKVRVFAVGLVRVTGGAFGEATTSASGLASRHRGRAAHAVMQALWS